MNYNDEQHRFGQVARQWNMVKPGGGEKWNALLEEFLELDLFFKSYHGHLLGWSGRHASEKCRLAFKNTPCPA